MAERDELRRGVQAGTVANRGFAEARNRVRVYIHSGVLLSAPGSSSLDPLSSSTLRIRTAEFDRSE